MKFKVVCYTFFFILSSLANAFSKEVTPLAKGGVLDLRRQALDQSMPLNGEWEFYWQKLIIPSDSTKGMIVPFPLKWNDITIDDKKLPAFGYATYRLTLFLPKLNENLRIAMPDVYCAYNLFLNGKLVANNGKVANNEYDFEPHWQYKAIDIPLHTDTVKLVLQIANFVHSKGGIKDPILIGKSSHVRLDRERAEAIDLLLTGCLFMGGLFFLGLYLLGNRDKAILLFSLYCIVYCYRIMGVSNYVLHTILPDARWDIMIHLEYFSLFFPLAYSDYIHVIYIHKM